MGGGLAIYSSPNRSSMSSKLPYSGCAYILFESLFLLLRFVMDQFIVTINKKGHVKIWDLQLLLAMGSNSAATSKSLLIDAFSQPELRLCNFKQAVGELDRIMQVDQYQIVLGVKSLLSNGGVADWMYILDFIDDRNVELLTDHLKMETLPAVVSAKRKRVTSRRGIIGSVHSSSGVWKTTRFLPKSCSVAKRQRRHSL